MQAQLGALQEQLASAGAGSVILGHSSRSEAVIMAALVFAPPLVVEGLEEDDVDELARVRVDSGVHISDPGIALRAAEWTAARPHRWRPMIGQDRTLSASAFNPHGTVDCGPLLA
jgi:hypothetical protein